MIRFIVTALLCLLTTGCATDKEKAPAPEKPVETVTETVTEPTTETTTLDPIKVQLDQMSLDEKIGQMFMVAYRTDSGGNPVLYGNERISADIENYHIGGFVLFSENLQSVEQAKQYVAFLKENSNIPPFIAIDEEGGAVSRLGQSGIIYDYYIPSAAKMASQGKEAVSANYEKIALNLKSLGLNMDLAPDADINTNPANPVIGDRAFGTEAQTTAEMAAAAMKALDENGIIPVVKHFPGHGDTQTDSHKGITIMPHDMDRLEQTELVPFKTAIENGAPVIMAAHLTTPALSDSGLPATLDRDIISGLLRGKLGYDGVVMTDAMDMGAIVSEYTCGDAVIKAINADVDIILMPSSTSEAFEAVKAAVSDGTISEDEIDDSVYRILKLKTKLED